MLKINNATYEYTYKYELKIIDVFEERYWSTPLS